MSKKVKSLKRLSDKDLAKLIGGAKVGGASQRAAVSASGSTWLYDCWEGTCTAAMKTEALKKATPEQKAMLEKSRKVGK